MIVYLSNGSQKAGTPGNPLGLGYLGFGGLDRLDADLRSIQDRGDTPSLNWPWGHTTVGKHPHDASDRLQQSEGLPTMPPIGYSDELFRVIETAADRGPIQVWVGSFDLNREVPASHHYLASVEATLVYDHSSTLGFYHPGSRVVDTLARKTTVLLEAFWNTGPEYEWQHRYDAIGSGGAFRNWFEKGGRIPDGRKAYVIDGLKGELPDAADLTGNVERVAMKGADNA